MLSLKAIQVPTGQLSLVAPQEGGASTTPTKRAEPKPVAASVRPAPLAPAPGAQPALLRTPSTCDRMVAAAAARREGDCMRGLADLTRGNAAVTHLANGINPWKFT